MCGFLFDELMVVGSREVQDIHALAMQAVDPELFLDRACCEIRKGMSRLFWHTHNPLKGHIALCLGCRISLSLGLLLGLLSPFPSVDLSLGALLSGSCLACLRLSLFLRAYPSFILHSHADHLNAVHCAEFAC